MVLSCCAFGCNEKFVKGGPVTFHSFPKDAERRKTWEVSVHRENFKASDYSKICSKHFTVECFNRERFGGTWLNDDAVPTIFNFPPCRGVKRRECKPAEKKSSETPTAVIETSSKPKKPCRISSDTAAVALITTKRKPRRPPFSETCVSNVDTFNQSNRRCSETCSGDENMSSSKLHQQVLETSTATVQAHHQPSRQSSETSTAVLEESDDVSQLSSETATATVNNFTSVLHMYCASNQPKLQASETVATAAAIETSNRTGEQSLVTFTPAVNNRASVLHTYCISNQSKQRSSETAAVETSQRKLRKQQFSVTLPSVMKTSSQPTEVPSERILTTSKASRQPNQRCLQTSAVTVANSTSVLHTYCTYSQPNRQTSETTTAVIKASRYKPRKQQILKIPTSESSKRKRKKWQSSETDIFAGEAEYIQFSAASSISPVDNVAAFEEIRSRHGAAVMKRKLRYVGDFTVEDLTSPGKAAKFLKIAKSQNALLRKRLKVLRNKNKRLHTRVSSLKNVIIDLKRQAVSISSRAMCQANYDDKIGYDVVLLE